MTTDAQPSPSADSERTGARGRTGLILGPLLAVATYSLLPAATLNESGDMTAGLVQAGRVVGAVGVLMAVYWVTEALPVAATALIPLALFPLLTGGTMTVRSVAAPYAHELIFLFMGGFLLALTIERWGLHRRMALRILLLVGTHPARLVAGFMIATAFLSMWVSNTATTVMMLPIGMSVIASMRVERGGPCETEDADRKMERSNFPVCLMLGIAYSASIGGIGTLVGTPPNTLLAAFVSDQYGVEISFARWMLVGLPLVVVFLPVTWVVLTKIVYPIGTETISGSRELIAQALSALGSMSRGERTVLVVFVLTAGAWVTRPLLVEAALSDGRKPLAGLTDAGIAIGAALVLFAVPVDWKRGVFLLTWRQAAKLPWNILILFGGGLSLASAVRTTGVAEYLGDGLSRFDQLPAPMLTVLVAAVVIFLTELTSNTATTAAFLPVLAAVAVGMGANPLLLLVPAVIAASCAFMLPVATPPNAIVFASGALTIPQMCKAGLWLNVIGVVLVTVLAYAVVIPVLGTTLP